MITHRNPTKNTKLVAIIRTCKVEERKRESGGGKERRKERSIIPDLTL